MTNFEKHIGESLAPSITAHLNSTSMDQLEKQARKLEFESWCPLSFENDSPEFRADLKQASELIFKWINYKK